MIILAEGFAHNFQKLTITSSNIKEGDCARASNWSGPRSEGRILTEVSSSLMILVKKISGSCSSLSGSRVRKIFGGFFDRVLFFPFEVDKPGRRRAFFRNLVALGLPLPTRLLRIGSLGRKSCPREILIDIPFITIITGHHHSQHVQRRVVLIKCCSRLMITTNITETTIIISIITNLGESGSAKFSS